MKYQETLTIRKREPLHAVIVLVPVVSQMYEIDALDLLDLKTVSSCNADDEDLQSSTSRRSAGRDQQLRDRQ